MLPPWPPRFAFDYDSPPPLPTPTLPEPSTELPQLPPRPTFTSDVGAVLPRVGVDDDEPA